MKVVLQQSESNYLVWLQIEKNQFYCYLAVYITLFYIPHIVNLHKIHHLFLYFRT